MNAPAAIETTVGGGGGDTRQSLLERVMDTQNNPLDTEDISFDAAAAAGISKPKRRAFTML